MNQTAGAILRRKVGAIQTRGYSFPIQSELAAKGANSTLRVTIEAIVEQSRVGHLDTLIDALPLADLDPDVRPLVWQIGLETESGTAPGATR